MFELIRFMINRKHKIDSDSADVFLDTRVTARANPFKKKILPNIFVPTIEYKEGSGGKLTIHGYISIAYCLQTDDRPKVTIIVNNQPYVTNFKFRLLAPQQIKKDEKNNGLSEYKKNQMIINYSSSVLLLDKRTEEKKYTGEEC